VDLWRLPRPDFHRLVNTDFQDTPLALRPGDSLAILEDGFVNRLQDAQFPSFLLFKLRGLNFYPGGALTHCSCQPSLDAHLSFLIGQDNSKLLLDRKCLDAKTPKGSRNVRADLVVGGYNSNVVWRNQTALLLNTTLQ
jgi:hypothetical protein